MSSFARSGADLLITKPTCADGKPLHDDVAYWAPPHFLPAGLNWDQDTMMGG